MDGKKEKKKRDTKREEEIEIADFFKRRNPSATSTILANDQERSSSDDNIDKVVRKSSHQENERRRHPSLYDEMKEGEEEEEDVADVFILDDEINEGRIPSRKSSASNASSSAKGKATRRGSTPKATASGTSSSRGRAADATASRDLSTSPVENKFREVDKINRIRDELKKKTKTKSGGERTSSGKSAAGGEPKNNAKTSWWPSMRRHKSSKMLSGDVSQQSKSVVREERARSYNPDEFTDLSFEFKLYKAHQEAAAKLERESLPSNRLSSMVGGDIVEHRGTAGDQRYGGWCACLKTVCLVLSLPCLCLHKLTICFRAICCRNILTGY